MATSVVDFVGLTAVQMIVGELMPKTVALRHPVPVAKLLVRPVELTAWLLHPLIVVLNGARNLLV